MLKVSDENSKIWIHDPDQNPDPQRHGSADPDPHKYVMDPEHWFLSSRKYDPGRSFRIQDPDPPHWFLLYFFLEKIFLKFPFIKLYVFFSGCVQLDLWVPYKARKHGSHNGPIFKCHNEPDFTSMDYQLQKFRGQVPHFQAPFLYHRTNQWSVVPQLANYQVS